MGAEQVTLTGTITTTIVPENTSYVIMSVSDTAVWHSSFVQSVLDFKTRDIKGLIHGSGIECNLEFFQIANIQGPFSCQGKIVISYSE